MQEIVEGSLQSTNARRAILDYSYEIYPLVLRLRKKKTDSRIVM